MHKLAYCVQNLTDLVSGSTLRPLQLARCPDLALKQHVEDIGKILTMVGPRYRGGRLALSYQQCYNRLDEWIRSGTVSLSHIIEQSAIRGSGKH